MTELSLQSQLNDLRCRVEELEEGARQLAIALAPQKVWPAWLPSLTRREEQLLALLAKREFVSHAAVEVLWGPHAEDIHSLTASYILKLRAKLAVGGVEILNKRGEGFYISAEGRQRLLADAALDASALQAAAIAAPAPEHQGPVLPLWRHERLIIERAIEHFAGDVYAAAAALEVSPSTIYRKRGEWAA